VYEEMKAEGLVDLAPFMDPASPEWYKISLTYGNGFKNRHLSNEELQQILSNAYRQFIVYKLTRPRTYLNLIRKLRSWEDVRYLFGLLHYPLGMIKRMLLGRRLSNLSIRSTHHAELHKTDPAVAEGTRRSDPFTSADK
jgi:hypothetical protein